MGIVALRLLSVFFFVKALTNTLSYLSMASSAEWTINAPMYGYIGIPYLVAIMLWLLAPSIGRGLAIESNQNLNERSLITILGFMLGVYLAVTNAGLLIGSLATASNAGQSFVEAVAWNDMFVILIALVFVFKPQVLLSLYDRKN